MTTIERWTIRAATGLTVIAGIAWLGESAAGTQSLFSANPIYRGSTRGSYFLVFNTILNFDNLDAGRTLDPR